MHSSRCALALLTLLLFAPPLSPQSGNIITAITAKETLHYGVDWRLITAGKARLSRAPAPTGWNAGLHLESTGLVSRLYKVNDDYAAALQSNLCAVSSFLAAHEGRRHRETRITFDAQRKKASYLERDLTKNAVVASHEIDVPDCTHEIVGALYKLRELNLEPGQSAQIPVSDGKKSVAVRVEALSRENIKPPAGSFKTVRYEAHLFNNVLYRRSGRVYIWLTDDARRLPVQIQVRLQFHIGTITLQLKKAE